MAQGSSEQDRVVRVLQVYVAAFALGDAPGVARCCQAPFMWITADEVSLAVSPEEIERKYVTVLDGLRERGFSRTEGKQLRVRMLGPALAIASGWAVRYAGDAELERLGATYLLRKTEEDWRIVVLTTHSSDRAALDSDPPVAWTGSPI